MTDLVIEREYMVGTDGRDEVSFNLNIPESLAPTDGATMTFSLEYLAITEADAKRAAKAKNPATFKKTPGNPQTDFMTLGASEPGKPISLWSAFGEQTYYLGRIKAHFEWKDSANQSQFAETEFDAGNTLNAQQNLVLGTETPRLCEILQTASPPAMVGGGTTLSERAVEVIKGIHGRLVAGLKTAWIAGGAPTKNGQSYTEVPLDQLTNPEELEECWAQHISELLVATNYSGTGPTYGTTNVEIFSKTADTTDPGAGLAYACQMLATMACITRGLDDAATNPLDASSASPVTTYTRGAANTGTLNTDASNRNAATAIANGILAPGIAYVKEKSARHIAFVLRGLKDGHLQLLDTGAMRTNPDHSAPFPTSGFNYDTVKAESITSSFEHIGVIPKAGALHSAIERMRRTKPLGLARLLLLDRSKSTSSPMRERLLWASPFIPLWNAATPTENYPISLLCWSLRDQIHRNEIAAWWMIDVPIRRPLRTKVLASRDFSWSPDYALDQRVTSPHSLSLADISSTADGGFRWVGSLVYADPKNDNNWDTYWRHEDGSVTQAYSSGRRDAKLEALPIDAVHPGDATVTADDKFVLKGCRLKTDGTLDTSDSSGFPNRLVFPYFSDSDFPAMFKRAP